MTIRPPRRTSCSSRRSGRWAKPCASGPRSGSPVASSRRRDRGKGTPSRRARDRTPSRSRRAGSSCSRPSRRRRLRTPRRCLRIPFVPTSAEPGGARRVPSRWWDPHTPRVPPPGVDPSRSCASRCSPAACAATQTASAATTRPTRSSNAFAPPRGGRRRALRRRWRGSGTRTTRTRRRRRRASRTATGYSPIGSCRRFVSGARGRRRRRRRRRRRATSGGGGSVPRRVTRRVTRRMTRWKIRRKIRREMRSMVCRTKGTGWPTSRGAAASSRLSFTSATAWARRSATRRRCRCRPGS
mmetsp:Transcript_10233/g.44488  ORF Transcript_10233/g.44488 Transcript_10233/m.44488 type:complete len:298 (-) Transcript_10233:1400-2293(-)